MRFNNFFSPQRKVLFIFFCGFYILAVQSFGSENYHWRNFTKLGGLVSNNVNDIAQDKQGNLWFATGAGVSRYNGMSTEPNHTFWHNYTVNYGLRDNDVVGVVVDDSGKVWFGTAGGVCYFDSSTFRTTEISDQVLCITKSMQNEIWVGTNKGAAKFDGDNWTLWTYDEGDLELGVTAILQDSSGKSWFGINSSPPQLSCFDGAGWLNYSVGDGLPAGRIQSICEDTNGNIWIGTSDGAAKFDGNSWKIYTVVDGLAGNDVREIMVDRNGTLWFATSNGVCVFDGKNWRTIQKSDGLVSNDVQAILEDRDGGIWVGTRDRGVSYADRKWQSVTSQSVLPDNTINAIFEDSHGNMWFGTPNGLVKFDGDEWTTITTDDGLPGNKVRAIAELLPSQSSISSFSSRSRQDFGGQSHQYLPDRARAHAIQNSGLWVGTDKGIGVYDGVSWSILTQLEGTFDSVHAIFADTAGNVWVGTGLYEPRLVDLYGGLSKFDGDNWETMPSIGSTVSCILEDSHGTLWACTYNDGIRRIYGDKIDEIKTEDGLASNSVFTAVEHPNGTVWFGTSGGISIFDYDNETWSALTTDDGLADNRVRTIFIDRQSVWVGTADGVSLFRDEPPRWIQYTVADGLISNSVNSIYVSNKGDVWFGTTDSGLTRHIREEIPPKTRIVDGPKGTIGVRTVTFEYIGSDASTPEEQLLYSHRLDDFPWSSFTSKTFVTFSNLADKENHTFVVKAQDKAGNVDTIGAKALFTIDASPPFVAIDAPLENQVISKNYEIKGSAIDKSDFKEYKIEVVLTSASTAEPNFSTDWIPNPVERDTLASWNTQDVDDGIYTITLSARDTIDGKSDIQHTNHTTVEVEVDNTKPDVEIISPVSSEDSAEVKIEAAIEDKNLKSYKLTYVQACSEEKIIDFVESTEVEYKYRWDSSNVYGETTLKVSAEDTAGNVGTDEVKIVLKNDSAKPIVKINSPNKNEVIAGNVSIVGTADDSTLKEFLLEYSDGTEWRKIRHGNDAVKNDVIAIWNTEQLADGAYAVRLKATDDKGYSSSTEQMVQIDNTAPTASIDSPKDGSIIQGSVDTEIIGTAYDENFGTARLEYASLDEPNQWNLIGESILSTKQSEMLKIWNSSGYEGKFQLRLTVTDRAGNSAIDTQIVTVDSVGVQLEIVEPTESQVVSGEVPIVGTAHDANFGHYSLQFRKESNGKWQTIVPQITKQKENEQLGVWDTHGMNGVFSVKLTGVDRSGHSSEIEINGIRVDNSPPVVSLDYPKNNQQVGSVVELSGTVTDDNLLEYTVKYSRPDVEPIEWHSISPVPFSKSVHSGYLGTWNLPDQAGKYALRLQATDSVGHQSETKISVSLPPVIDSQKGGSASGEHAWIVIPPNALATSTVITINKVDKNTYEFSPEVTFINSLKPATITISYTAEDNAMNIEKVPSLFFYEPATKEWKEIGGTTDQDNRTVTAAVDRTGRYALRWVDVEENEGRANISNLACQPRVFRPNMDYQSIAISFELSSQAEVTVKVYNPAGRLKRVVKKNVTLRKGSNVLHWDARDDDYRQVTSGLYIVTVQTDKQVVEKGVVVWND